MRITGGLHRSRTLEAPRGDATRPTSDRVREALFAILGGRLDGARVLDLYAGTGALAFEALSRGAATALLVESARPPLQAIQTNARALGLERLIKVVPTTVERAASLVERASPFDVVFADPPYSAVTDGDAVRAIAKLLEGPVALLSDDACIVLEHSKADTAPELPKVSLTETRRYGDTCLSFYRATTPFPQR
jgi:16S rRNA (guanine(966)-N(2))-methyltransferase RsmD